MFSDISSTCPFVAWFKWLFVKQDYTKTTEQIRFLILLCRGVSSCYLSVPSLRPDHVVQCRIYHHVSLHIWYKCISDSVRISRFTPRLYHNLVYFLWRTCGRLGRIFSLNYIITSSAEIKGEKTVSQANSLFVFGWKFRFYFIFSWANSRSHDAMGGIVTITACVTHKWDRTGLNLCRV